ncbi:DUF6265 family protein [Asticcacaulis sp. ZE23SCel15]|uniref:DUF6265 family protein n=1 Tax=Asticcacaulis sp. ZE23SCel15 TaxID=3059027 RepID=UPI00265E8BAB|nr:DUF6265 family protein [Asticcacaulis sp. ZE23SCel15]WKL57357.1 DUF6265 family protein [Asticcacaulis sp. ZE23SCel15]
MLNRRDCVNVIPAVLVVAGVAAGAQAQNPRSMIRLLSPGQAPKPCALSDLKWLEGDWIGQMPFGPVENVVLPIAFGHMPGFVRATNADGVVFYEIVVFAQVGPSVANRVKHFSSNLEGWEARETYIERLLVDREGDTYFFDGITLSRTGPDSYRVFFLNRDGDKELDTIVVPFRRKD